MTASPFRVVLSGDFKKPDGSPTFPDFDVSPLQKQPGVDTVAREPDWRAADRAGKGLSSKAGDHGCDR